MVYILLGSILLLRVAQKITGKSCSKLMPTDLREIIAYMSIRMGISAVTAFAVLIIAGNFINQFINMPPLGWLISTLTGLSLTVSTVCMLLAMKKTSVVLASLFGAAGLLVPTIAGIFIYGQSVAIGQWIGILFLFVATIFLSSSSKDTNGKITLKTLLLLFGEMLANGSTMLLQTLYKNYVPNGSVSLYSFLQFALPALILFLVALIWSAKNKSPIPKTDKRLLGYTVIAAAAVFGISQISTIASALIPVAVLFPISDGGGMVISAVVAALIFKEKWTVKSVCGITIGVAAIIMIKLLV